MESARWSRRVCSPAERTFVDEVVSRLTSAMGDGGGEVIDLGCGTGGHRLALARLGVATVGVDVAPGMLRWAERARQTAGVANARFEAADLNRRLPFEPASFAGAVCGCVIQYLGDVPAFLAE